eukprot:m.214751 g.214751  ORF g.214751 m.214751 type:complete len:216 (-) comp27344_c0_seq1:28-675(-)
MCLRQRAPHHHQYNAHEACRVFCTPWHLYVVTGARRDAVCRAARMAVMGTTGSQPQPNEEAPFALYPPPAASEAYMQRRRKLGYDMYSLMGVDRKDKAGRAAAMLKNYDFFDAPIGIFVTVDKIVDKNGWAHVGALAQTICLLANECGMATCLQEAWSEVGWAVTKELRIPDSQVLWCGIALGYADPRARVNTLRSQREPLDSIVHWEGFADSKL